MDQNIYSVNFERRITMFSQNLIDSMYEAIKASGVDGSLTVDSETMEINNGFSGIQVFFSVSDSESKNKARIELALHIYY